MGKPTILLIEDNADDEVLTLRALRAIDLDLTVDVVRDGAEALDYLMGRGKYAGRRAASPPQLILVDLKLPKIDGLDLVRRIKETEAIRLVPVVVLTTSDEDCDITRSYRAGANSYIRKPVDFARFRESIRLIGRYWLQLNRAPRAEF